MHWGCLTYRIPNQKLVVITARCQLRLAVRPLETGNFLFVAMLKLDKRVLRRPHIKSVNGLVSATRCQQVRCPSKASNSSIVNTTISEKLLSLGVPNLHKSLLSRNSQLVAAFAPVNRGHGLILAKVT